MLKTALTVLITAVVTVVVAGLIAWGVYQKTKSAREKPTDVRLESPGRGDLVEIITGPGEVEPRRKVSISSRISARIVELPFEEGDEVCKGQTAESGSVLLRLDASDLEAALRSAEARREASAAQIKVSEAELASQRAQLVGNRASLAEAERELKRQGGLRETRDVSEAVFEQAECRVEELRAGVGATEHTVQARQLMLSVLRHRLAAADEEIVQARDQLGYTTIVSPIDGVVTRVNAEEGELAITGTMNNPGTVIMEVADLSEMLVVAQINEADIGAVKEGQRAGVRIRAYPDEEFEGTVETIALVGAGQPYKSKVFRVEIRLDASGRKVYSGLTAEVDVETERHSDVLKVPSQAVLGRKTEDLPADVRKSAPHLDKKKAYATVVYRMVDGKAVATPVEVGPSDEMHTVIRGGLSETDTVITGPFKVLEKLKHDQKVRDEREKEAEERKDGEGEDGVDPNADTDTEKGSGAKGDGEDEETEADEGEASP